MSRRTQLLIGVGLGVLAVVFMNFYLRSLRKSLYQGMEFGDILTASQDLAAGTQLTDAQITAVPYPKRYTHPHALSPRDKSLILGQRIQIDVVRGQPILLSDVGGEIKPGGEFAATIRKNERAVTLVVDEATSLSGLIRPNDHVDILATLMDSSGEGARTTTITLLQNVTVIAVGTAFGRSGAATPNLAYSTVTVSVSPEEAEILVFVQERGKISITLRNPQNLVSETSLPKITLDDIIQKEVLQRIQSKRDIEIIRGSSK